MKVVFSVPNTDDQNRTFLTWVPVKAQLKLEDADNSVNHHDIILQNAGPLDGGRVVFDHSRSHEGLEQLTVSLPSDGTAIDVWIAGEFGKPSNAYGDTIVQAVDANGTEVGRHELMVRIRKNAVRLTDDERLRFLDALATLNDEGAGPFQSFRDMHDSSGYPEEHFFAGFLPWHRAYLLDLERSLQSIDASVTLPYWRFDEPAPTLFADNFFGMPDSNPLNGNEVIFPNGHPLEFWKTDGGDAILRRPRPGFDINSAPPSSVTLPDGTEQELVINQADTLNKGNVFDAFRTMEEAPHGFAHTSFSGWIRDPTTAPKDPLFFLLHCNVDRLWGLWQWFNKRTKEDMTEAYPPNGSERWDGQGNIGSALDDTMWPWNGETTPPRPSMAPPRPSFPPSPLLSAPGNQPTVRSMIDFQGVHSEVDLAFGYDDVPFELETDGVGV